MPLSFCLLLFGVASDFRKSTRHRAYCISNSSLATVLQKAAGRRARGTKAARVGLRKADMLCGKRLLRAPPATRRSRAHLSTHRPFACERAVSRCVCSLQCVYSATASTLPQFIMMRVGTENAGLPQSVHSVAAAPIMKARSMVRAPVICFAANCYSCSGRIWPAQ